MADHSRRNDPGLSASVIAAERSGSTRSDTAAAAQFVYTHDELHRVRQARRQVRVRGHSKVLCHLMFGVLAMTVDQLLRLVN